VIELNPVPFKPLSEVKKRIYEECPKLESIETQKASKKIKDAGWKIDKIFL
jgi:hypothetical protein